VVGVQADDAGRRGRGRLGRRPSHRGPTSTLGSFRVPDPGGVHLDERPPPAGWARVRVPL
jgi:hypothetical protein